MTPTIRRFRPTDQLAARALIEAGLGEHFAHLDREANPDLVDIQSSYEHGAHAFFVAEHEGQIVGTTAVIFEPTRCRLVRVAVAREHRRLRVATALLSKAIAFARERGVLELVVYTQPEWSGALAFYQSHGFEIFGRDDIDVHLRRPIG